MFATLNRTDLINGEKAPAQSFVLRVLFAKRQCRPRFTQLHPEIERVLGRQDSDGRDHPVEVGRAGSEDGVVLLVGPVAPAVEDAQNDGTGHGRARRRHEAWFRV